MSEALRRTSRVERVAAATAAVLLAATLLFWHSGLIRGSATGLHLTRGASASGAGPPPPPVEAIEAEVVARLCSATYRATVAAAVANGSSPALIGNGWSCNGMEACSGEFVGEQVALWRSMPERYGTLLGMVPCDLYQAIRNRTLWIVGDSNAQRWYKQIHCLLEAFQHPPGQRVTDRFTDDINYQQVIQHELNAGFEGGGTDVPYCAHLLGGTRVCHFRANFLGHVLHFMKHLHILNARPKRDIVAFNVGLWHNKRVRYIDKFLSYTNVWVPALNASLIQGLADYWQQHNESMPVMIWRDHSPQHFKWEHGEFPHPDDRWKLKDRTCRSLETTLQPNGTLVGPDPNVLAGGWRNIISTPIWQASGIPILHTWNDTIMMHDGHSAKGDCTHFCSPGAYSLWIWGLWQVIEGLQLPKP